MDIPEFSAPYLQLLGIEEAFNNGWHVNGYLAELEDYLWQHYDHLESDNGTASKLLREGLLRLAKAVQLLADSSGDENWLELAHRGNQLIISGSRNSEENSNGFGR